MRKTKDKKETTRLGLEPVTLLKQALATCALVCRSWQQLVDSDVLWAALFDTRWSSKSVPEAAPGMRDQQDPILREYTPRVPNRKADSENITYV
jgi:hypothetical protein